ncbi:hypothetical protein ACP70R_044812 [Stipagrostis hirtigluma subsp. patula]
MAAAGAERRGACIMQLLRAVASSPDRRATLHCAAPRRCLASAASSASGFASPAGMPLMPAG